MKWIIGLLLSAAIATAQASSEKVVAASSLAYRTHLGATGQFSLIVRSSEKGKTVIVDGITLTQSQKARATPYLTRILQMSPEVQKLQCPAGEFEHLVLLNGKKQSEHGCIADKSFADLKRSFQALKK